MQPADIEDLIGRVAIGDRAAFDALYEATNAKLFGVCLRVLKQRSAAEDAMQDCYVKIWKHADRYAVNGYSPMSWMITIARNTAIDRLRARKPTEDIDSYSDRLSAPVLTPEQQAQAKSEARQITGCLEELQKDRRSAVQAVYLDGDSYADLANRFDVPLNTMRTWLRRSLISLRDCMSR